MVAYICMIFHAAENFSFKIISFASQHYLEMKVTKESLASFLIRKPFRRG